ncbi:hypothetical protein PABG_05355 [Paracoccidioides brasiliensis Pb03]|nr:hypothetical protein PABG_05355 [Paracoccidioides brasiliensis Pb03]
MLHLERPPAPILTAIVRYDGIQIPPANPVSYMDRAMPTAEVPSPPAPMPNDGDLIEVMPDQLGSTTDSSETESPDPTDAPIPTTGEEFDFEVEPGTAQ